MMCACVSRLSARDASPNEDAAALRTPAGVDNRATVRHALHTAQQLTGGTCDISGRNVAVVANT